MVFVNTSLFINIKELYFIVLVKVPRSENSVCRWTAEQFLPPTHARQCFNMADLAFLMQTPESVFV